MVKNTPSSILTKVFFFLFFFFLLIQPQTVLAYLDMYTGSYLLQLLLGGIFGLLFAIKIFWKKIKNLGYQIFSKNKENSRYE